MIVPCATQRMTWESKRWQFVAKEVLHAMECCGGEGRARVRICGVVRRALCWLALLYACFQSGLLVLCSSAMRVVVFVVERVRLPLSAHLRGRGRCRWILRRCEVVKEKCGFSVSCRCVAGSESALCLAVREFATLRMKSWCCWLRQRVVCGRVECLLDSNRCRVSQWIPFTGGGSPISFLFVSIHCYWITIAFTAIGEGKGENRNSVPKRDVVIEWIVQSILQANE